MNTDGEKEKKDPFFDFINDLTSVDTESEKAKDNAEKMKDSKGDVWYPLIDKFGKKSH